MVYENKKNDGEEEPANAEGGIDWGGALDSSPPSHRYLFSKHRSTNGRYQTTKIVLPLAPSEVAQHELSYNSVEWRCEHHTWFSGVCSQGTQKLLGATLWTGVTWELGNDSRESSGATAAFTQTFDDLGDSQVNGEQCYIYHYTVRIILHLFNVSVHQDKLTSLRHLDATSHIYCCTIVICRTPPGLEGDGLEGPRLSPHYVVTCKLIYIYHEAGGPFSGG